MNYGRYVGNASIRYRDVCGYVMLIVCRKIYIAKLVYMDMSLTFLASVHMHACDLLCIRVYMCGYICTDEMIKYMSEWL